VGRKPEPFPPRPHRHGKRACVCWRRRHYHLGGWSAPPGDGSEGVLAPPAAVKFGQLLQLWAEDPSAVPHPAGTTIVASLVAEYLDSADAPTEKRARARLKTAARLLLEQHGTTPVDEFGPLKLKAWQRYLAGLEDDSGRRRFNRTTVSQLIACVRRIWKWGVATERLEQPQYAILLTVSGPRPGECRESSPRPAADPDAVRATLPFLRPPARAIIELMMHTGARPGEICRLTPGEVFRSGKVDLPGAGVVDLDATGVWVYAPRKHKTAHIGKWKWIIFGKRSRAVLAPFLLRGQDEYCFSAREAVDGLHVEQRAARLARGGGSGGSRKPAVVQRRRQWRDFYTPDTLRQAVCNAVRLANRARAEAGERPIGAFSPYMLRHLFASGIADLDQARAALGHSDPQVTLRYAKRDFAAAVRVASERG